jgi:aspartate aminotransferase
MKLAKSLERLGTESAFSVLAEAKKLEAQGQTHDSFRVRSARL